LAGANIVGFFAYLLIILNLNTNKIILYEIQMLGWRSGVGVCGCAGGGALLYWPSGGDNTLVI
jgi:hypothetical protein